MWAKLPRRVTGRALRDWQADSGLRLAASLALDPALSSVMRSLVSAGLTAPALARW